MKGLITICARGGSKGIPGKNIKFIGGKPLIAYSIEVALSFAKNWDSDIFLSTDSKEIKDVVKALEFSCVNTDYNRPDFLANDSAGKLDAIKDIKCYAENNNNYNYDFVIDLDVTSPLRTKEDLSRAINILFDNEDAVNLFSVSPANRNPYFNMVEENSDGFLVYVKPANF